jgi:hypothetical protein
MSDPVGYTDDSKPYPLARNNQQSLYRANKLAKPIPHGSQQSTAFFR